MQEKCLEGPQEEMRLATLCMQYLTFDYFDTALTPQEISEYVKVGNYAFLDYASLHWFHHLEATLTSLKPNDFGPTSDLVTAMNDFFEMYEPNTQSLDKEHEEYKTKSAHLKDVKCYEDLLLLLSQAKSHRISREKLEALGGLGTFVSRIRSILEELSASSTLSKTTKDNLTEFYGNKWHKCSRHACYYFHEGFSTQNALLQHTNRHEKPFCCTEIGCTRTYIGWSTEKELKRHMNKYHPDPEAFSWKFPHVKRTPTTFKCDICEKTYSRSNILSTHKKNKHTKEREFTCKVSECGKGFVRKCDLERHGAIHKGKAVSTEGTPTIDPTGGESSQEFLREGEKKRKSAEITV